VKIERIRSLEYQRYLSDIYDYHYIHLLVQDAAGKTRHIIRVTPDESDDEASFVDWQAKLEGFTVTHLGGGKVKRKPRHDLHEIWLYGFSEKLGKDQDIRNTLRVFRCNFSKRLRWTVVQHSLADC
jgi:hypothetical protein